MQGGAIFDVLTSYEHEGRREGSRRCPGVVQWTGLSPDERAVGNVAVRNISQLNIYRRILNCVASVF